MDRRAHLTTQRIPLWPRITKSDEISPFAVELAQPKSSASRNARSLAARDLFAHPPLPTRLMAGVAILKHTYNLSDEALCARWIENPYFQFFCCEEFFRHKLPFDRSSITRWRQRMGEERLNALVQQSLSVAVRTKALCLSDLSHVIVETTVQEKAVMFPTDARLLDRARVRLVKLAKKHGVRLRQSYVRVGKLALMKHQRYAHAKHFKRARAKLRS